MGLQDVNGILYRVASPDFYPLLPWDPDPSPTWDKSLRPARVLAAIMEVLNPDRIGDLSMDQELYLAWSWTRKWASYYSLHNVCSIRDCYDLTHVGGNSEKGSIRIEELLRIAHHHTTEHGWILVSGLENPAINNAVTEFLLEGDFQHHQICIGQRFLLIQNSTGPS